MISFVRILCAFIFWLEISSFCYGTFAPNAEGVHEIIKLKRILQDKVNSAKKTKHHSFLHNQEIEFIQKEIDFIHEHLLTLEKEDPRNDKKYLKGDLDPQFPVSMKTKPIEIEIAKSLNLPFKGSMRISDIPINVLKTLSKKQMKKFLEYLGKIEVELKWKDKKGINRSGKKVFGLRFNPWEETNAAAALALAVGIHKEKKLLTDMAVSNPDSVALGLKGKAYAIFNAEIVCEALVRQIASVNLENSREIASSAENIVQGYLEYWAEKNPQRLTLALTRLVLITTKRIEGYKPGFDAQKKGILLGDLLAAALQRAHKIKTQDEKRLWIINSISNLAWAASTFFGAIPLAGTQTAILAGSLSVAVVSWGVIFSKIGVRDYTPNVREIEGHIEFLALEAAKAKGGSANILEILETLQWMRSTVHINGLSD